MCINLHDLLKFAQAHHLLELGEEVQGRIVVEATEDLKLETKKVLAEYPHLADDGVVGYHGLEFSSEAEVEALENLYYASRW